MVLWTARSRYVPDLRPMAGVLLLVVGVLLWVGLLWAGTTLMLLGGDPAVVDATSGGPASVAQVAYYAGFTVFTLGVGDYVAATDGWRVFTAFMSWPGLVLITLAITYLLSVVGAVVHRRAVAVHVRSLGGTAAEIVASGWDGRAAPRLPGAAVLPRRQVRHLGPAGAGDARRRAAAPRGGVAEQARPPRSATGPLRHAIDRHIVTSTGAGDPDGAEPAPLPLLDDVAAAGVPVVPVTRFDAAARRAERRRACLARFVAASGWSWRDDLAA